EESDKDKFVILAVDLRESTRKVKDFADKNGYTFPFLLDSSGSVGAKYKAYSLPTTFILDQEGKLIAKISGARQWSWEDFEKLIK
ncbi:MAG: TlpA disulfide reductase family protein, partial [Candidatus Margulisiibacteriota bacterium]